MSRVRHLPTLCCGKLLRDATLDGVTTAPKTSRRIGSLQAGRSGARRSGLTGRHVGGSRQRYTAHGRGGGPRGREELASGLAGHVNLPHVTIEPRVSWNCVLTRTPRIGSRRFSLSDRLGSRVQISGHDGGVPKDHYFRLCPPTRQAAIGIPPSEAKDQFRRVREQRLVFRCTSRVTTCRDYSSLVGCRPMEPLRDRYRCRSSRRITLFDAVLGSASMKIRS